MKTSPFIALGLGLLALCGSPSKGFGETTNARPAPADSAKDRAKWRLATLSAAREILDELNQPKPLGMEDRAILLEKLNTAMRADVKTHAARAASRTVCTGIAIRMRRDSLEQRFKDVTAHANERSPTPILWSDVASHLGVGWSNTVEQTLRSFSDTELEPLFKDARNRAVGLLRQEWEQNLHFPSEKELNDILVELLARHPDTLRLSGNDEKQLQQKIAALANPDNAVCFEELKSLLNNQTHTISSEIRKQYEQQLTLLESTAAKGVPDDQRQAAVISTALITAIESGLATERVKATGPQYPLLAPIRNSIPGRAAKLETDRLVDFMARHSTLAIQTDPLAKAIRSNPEAHHTSTASETVFTQSLAPALRDQTITVYASGANPAGKADYFKTLLTTNTIISGAFQSRFSRELNTGLPVARQIVSTEQFTKSFISLEKPSILSPEALLALQDSGGAPLTNLTETLKLFDLSDRNSNKLLEETVTRILTIANQKAREGYDILTAQLALVRKLEQERLDKLRRDIAVKRPFKDIRTEWQSALETLWGADSRARTTPYKDLLDLTVASLNKAVRQLYDSVKDNPNTTATPTPAEARPSIETEQGRIKDLRQDPAKPEDQNQEQPKEVQPPTPKISPKAGGSEGASNTVLSRTRVDRRNEPDGIVLLTAANTGPATVRLLSQTGTTTCTASFDPGKPSDAADTIFNALKPQLKVMWVQIVSNWQREHSGFGILKRRTPPKLKLFIVIESDDIRHRMSLRLRQHIEEALQDWYKSGEKGTPEVELDWKVGLTFDPATQAP
jgi:hypothetical protein